MKSCQAEYDRSALRGEIGRGGNDLALNHMASARHRNETRSLSLMLALWVLILEPTADEVIE
jgi:hypothetical protein